MRSFAQYIIELFDRKGDFQLSQSGIVCHPWRMKPVSTVKPITKNLLGWGEFIHM